MNTIKTMAMPTDFRYRDVFLKGKPEHDKYDRFRIRHPRMDCRRRAKIFAPFDALKGFNEAVSAKNVLYQNRIVHNPEDMEELNRRLTILRKLTCNSRVARANRIQVTVTYYEPCEDENHEAYGIMGTYMSVTGICMNVDAEVTKTILIDKMRIRLEDILNIESSGNLFQRDWIDQ